jgi:acetate kinase
MADTLLILNAGSSSLKFSIYLDDTLPVSIVEGQFESLTFHPRFRACASADGLTWTHDWGEGVNLAHQGAIEYLVTWGRSGVLGSHRIAALGHRVVHGGTRFRGPVRIDAGTIAELEALVPLAPLHQPHNLAAIKAAAEIAPHLPQVACFDTSFHLSQPAVAQSFALPRRFADEGVRRYGFHGLSYEYIASILPDVDAGAAAGRTVVAHLGNGASMCAMRGGRSVATTMGFSALDGLPMGTRCGSIDPGVLIYLIDRHGMGARALEELLYQNSGLLGVSGVSSDMRSLLGSANPRAAEAIDLFVYRIGRELGSLSSALGGLEALVFTGGIGENAAPIRSRVCRDAAWLGLELDEDANALGGMKISAPGSRVSAWVVPTDEESVIARHTFRLLETSGATTASP